MKPGDMIRVHIWVKPRTGILLEPSTPGIGLWRVLWNDGEIGRLSDSILSLKSTELVSEHECR